MGLPGSYACAGLVEAVLPQVAGVQGVVLLDVRRSAAVSLVVQRSAALSLAVQRPPVLSLEELISAAGSLVVQSFAAVSLVVQRLAAVSLVVQGSAAVSLVVQSTAAARLVVQRSAVLSLVVQSSAVLSLVVQSSAAVSLVGQRSAAVRLVPQRPAVLSLAMQIFAVLSLVVQHLGSGAVISLAAEMDVPLPVGRVALKALKAVVQWLLMEVVQWPVMLVMQPRPAAEGEAVEVMRAKELLLARWVSGVRAMTMAKLLPAELVVVMVVVQWLRVVMHLSVRASSGAVSLRLVRVLRAHGGGVALVVVIQHRRCAEAPPVVPVAKGWACGAVGSR